MFIIVNRFQHVILIYYIDLTHFTATEILILFPSFSLRITGAAGDGNERGSEELNFKLTQAPSIVKSQFSLNAIRFKVWFRRRLFYL